jgi:circadian clock protein KaiB
MTSTIKTKNTKQPKLVLRIYVVGKSQNSELAYDNLNKICQQHFPGGFVIEVIDLMKFPQLAKDDQILAVPTVVKKLPKPVRRMIGDLSNTEDVLVGLDLRPVIHKIDVD